mgnify:CR=1 FL=1
MFAPTVSTSTRIGLVDASNFDWAVKTAGPTDDQLGRYHSIVVNPPKPLRRCGRCRCPGHTKKNCMVFLPPNMSYWDDDRNFDAVRMRREEEENERITRVTHATPESKQQYMLRWARANRNRYGDRMSAFERYAYLDHDGFEEDSVADTINAVQQRLVERINGLQRQVDELRNDVQRDDLSYVIIEETPEHFVSNVRYTHNGRCSSVTMQINRQGVQRMMSATGQTQDEVLHRSMLRTARRYLANAPRSVEESNARAIRAAFGQGGGPSNDADLNEALRQSMETLNAAQAQASEEEEEPAAKEPIEETTCPICMEPLTKTNHIVGKCGHQFHASCLFQNLAYSKACPCCRKTVM